MKQPIADNIPIVNIYDLHTTLLEEIEYRSILFCLRHESWISKLNLESASYCEGRLYVCGLLKTQVTIMIRSMMPKY